ncbi:MAG TPA: ImmA/IrrE family metallo-endopeptidase [Gaiellaceae bacterium]|nr:ImmA/IrrE family metallo-endopeptidase [Gaiellaceae bacterium]
MPSVEEGSAVRRYEEPRAHALRARYLAAFGGPEIPVPVEAIAEDLLGLRIERRWMEHSGMLQPAERTIVVNAAEWGRDVPPLRRYRFTIAHELGHWVCHVLGAGAERAEPVYCRAKDLSEDADRALEREANVFAAELLMPEPAVRSVWEELVAQSHELDPVTACAARFDVSPTAMQWRLHSFGLAGAPAG